MSRNTVAAAAFNNARWCDAVCRAHGHPGELTDALWLNRAEVPPFYPNVVTLTPEGGARQLEVISELELPGRWAIKDSFATLDLAPLGFEELFSAQWIQFSSERMAPTTASGARWVQVRDTAALAAWEAAWRGQQGPAPTHAVFRPGLLEDAGVGIFAAYHEDTLVAGAIAYRAEGVVSLSNTFFAGSRARVLRAELLGQLLAAFPGLPLVGYERGDELAAWCALGFEPIGPLGVWLKKT